MSDTPDEDPSSESQGGQSHGGQGTGGQPQGARPNGGQPQGGQPQGGQPQGGQPQGGQPQGGQYQGQQPAYNTGPGIGDIFNRPSTLSEMKIGVTVFGAVGLGIGVAGIGMSLMSGGGAGSGGFGGGAVLGSMMMLLAILTLLFAPIIAGYLGLRQARVLEDEPTNLITANAGVTGLLGTLVVFVIGLVFFLLLGPSGAGQLIGDLILPGIVGAIGAGITGAIAAWATFKFVPRHAAPVQGNQQY